MNLLRKNPEARPLTRREVIRKGGVVVSVAPFLTLVRELAAEDKGLKAIDVNHISYQVQDYAKSRDFYASLLGMRPYMDTGKQCNLMCGDNTYIVVHNRRSDESQIDHVAYTITDWNRETVEALLKARGLEPKGLGDNPDSFMVKDPDGLGVQISGKGLIEESPKAAAEATRIRAVGVNHISYQVLDYAKSRDFYASLLGMKPYLDTGKTCNLMCGEDSYIVVHNRRTDESRIDHIAYTIADWHGEAVEADLKGRGLDPKGVGDNPDSLMVRDPDGLGVQLSGKGITLENPPSVKK